MTTDGIPPETLLLLRRFADLVVTDDITAEEWEHLHDALEPIVNHRDSNQLAESQYAAAFRQSILNMASSHSPGGDSYARRMIVYEGGNHE